MLTRREVILGTASAALIPIERGFAKASQPSTPVNFEIPPNACDCHPHIYGPQMWSQRNYTPETNTLAEMTKLHQALHMKRVVIITPGRVYGIDNSYTTARHEGAGFKRKKNRFD
jgi:hypothetical protein